MSQDDPGIAAVRSIYEQLQIDPEWSLLGKRGFRWWGCKLAQTVQASPAVDEDGTRVSRVRVTTDFLDDFDLNSVDGDFLEYATTTASLYGLARLPTDPHRVQWAMSMRIEREWVDWKSRLLAIGCAMQLAEADRQVRSLAESLGCKPAFTAHPRTGFRKEADEMLGLLTQMVIPAGRSDSLFDTRDVTGRALEFLQAPPCVLANGDDQSISAELPFGESTSLLDISTRTRHPVLGSGALFLLTFPRPLSQRSPEANHRLAISLNERDVRSNQGSHFLGSWYSDGQVTRYISFLPNTYGSLGAGIFMEVLASTLMRAKWATKTVFKSRWDYELALRNKLGRLSEMLERDEDESTEAAPRSRTGGTRTFERIDEALRYVVDVLADRNHSFIVTIYRKGSAKGDLETTNLFQIVSENIAYGTESSGFVFHLTFADRERFHRRFKRNPIFERFDYQPLSGISCYDLRCGTDVETTMRIAVHLARELYGCRDVGELLAVVSDEGPRESTGP